ncbi:hypothetical protein RHGRI_028838 [Rhododendron griersonianum]|uniref:Uncharacterized protein n=1 Tax=Rhododendron griersonianum TaxID=479676 RepID=A0AAV6IHI9_9ERIC|nr:hypothetical protein RHGRI_028838 [Rhododendron griersonianum]
MVDIFKRQMKVSHWILLSTSITRYAMINMLTVVWKPTCFYASKHFLSLSGCLVSGECLKALQQREKFMRKSKRAALWERLHERIARRVLSLMIELEGLWVKLGQYLFTRADVTASF